MDKVKFEYLALFIGDLFISELSHSLLKYAVKFNYCVCERERTETEREGYKDSYGLE